jgi:anti-sigma factor RsiW
MKENCLDIGMLQAFMDGELSHDQIVHVSDHLERCDSCTFMLGQAEDEAALVFSALDREFNTLVPTQRLWTKINNSIETERENRPFWEKLAAFISTTLANPSMVAAAGLLIVFGGFAILFLNREPVQNDIAALPDRTAVSIPQAEPVRTSAPALVEPAAVIPGDSIGDTVVDSGPRIERAVYRPRATVSSASSRAESTPPALVNGYLEGEESYVKTISSLSRTVEDQKEVILRPSELVAYERDMALVNDTISKMRQEVRRNPRNESAKQVLYTSYQNKIDLLSSVSQKEELVASLTDR